MTGREEHRPFDGERLSRRRPAPSRQFEDRLRRHLLEVEAGGRRPARLWLLVTAYAAAGTLLIIVAAVGVGS